MTGNSDEEKRLLEELRLIRQAARTEYKRLAPVWAIGVGPVRLRTAVNTQQITVVYVLFNLACFVAGFVFIFHQGVLQVLGISLVVGGLFSFGAFVAQFWTVAAQREQEIYYRALGQIDEDTRYAEIRRLDKAHSELLERIAVRRDQEQAGNKAPRSE